MKNILKNYRRRLVNLSSNNRALLLLRLSREMHLDVKELDYLISEPAFSIIERLMLGRKKIAICPYADSRYAPVTPVSRRLRYIRRKANMIFEERGSHELYIGWPFVHGKFADGTVVRCPLLFFPVQLQVNSGQEWELVQDATQQPHLNQSFLLAYAHYTGTPLAEELMDLDLASLSQHPLEFRTQLYEHLKEQLAITMGSELFSDRLKPFVDYRKADYELPLKPGQLYLQQEAVLGIYPQTASYLLADYDQLLERKELKTMEDLFTAPPKNFAKQALQAQNTFTAFAMDAAQELALQGVKQGKSLVVQGPPGTGKSQLICNLVSDFTARGKKVLVVSQKRAALDVVHQRLSSEGMGPFAALVHDIHTDRNAIFAQLLAQIESVEAYKKQNMALNSLYTDRTYLEVCRGINKCTETLSAFKSALFDTSRSGWSAKELYLKSNLSEPHLLLQGKHSFFTEAATAAFLPRLRQYLQQDTTFKHDNFPLNDRHSFKGWGWPQRQELEKTIRELPQQYAQLQQDMTAASGYTFVPDHLARYTAALPTIAQIQELLQKQDVAEVLQRLLPQKGKLGLLKRQVQELKSLYLVTPTPDAVIPVHELADLHMALAAYEQQQTHWLKAVTWVFSKEKEQLKEALARYNFELTDTDVAKLNARLALRHQAEQLMQAINNSINYTLQPGDQATPLLYKLKVVEQALEVYNLLQQLQQNQVLHEKQLQKAQVQGQFQHLAQCINSAAATSRKWRQWLPEGQINRLLAEPELGPKMLQALHQYFEQLVAHDTLFTAFSEQEQQMAEFLRSQGAASAKETEQLFLNSLYLNWIYDLEERHPELRMPSSGELEEVEKELQVLLAEKRKLSQEMVLSKLREETYMHLETNRLGNAVTYRRLQAQVSKKRSLYPLRKLLSLFRTEVLHLVPCWLMSPDSVSAVFPLEACFDLVIFDEASQCYAETGIPSILRGQQVVVAGDVQQLKPSDLYRTRWSTDDDEEPEELSAESLLELCGLHLPQTMLTQHYRSRFPELITFSNHHFYKQKLELIPNLRDVLASEPAVQFEKVKGIWKDNTNEPEARFVVAMLLDMLEAGQQDIGVITFNYNQQLLVQDLLEDAAQERGIAVPPAVIVKNIENMQGDEKEVIILSVGYAPDERGKLSMQFGSLNAAGGENRLNVAITRARQQVVVVSSLLPEQLQVEHTLHQGPKLLKAYLQYAQQVSQGGFAYQPRKEAIPTQVQLLKERLELEVAGLQQELPFADLTLQAGEQYTGVVLTDDDLYYSYPSVRHAHADLPQLLHQRNWPFMKVYSRQYWENKQKVLQRLGA